MDALADELRSRALMSRLFFFPSPFFSLSPFFLCLFQGSEFDPDRAGSITGTYRYFRGLFFPFSPSFLPLPKPFPLPPFFLALFGNHPSFFFLVEGIFAWAFQQSLRKKKFLNSPSLSSLITGERGFFSFSPFLRPSWGSER